jgi:hypothetical protein
MSQPYCSNDYDTYPVDCQLIATEHRTAKVKHDCSACANVIQPGERYTRILEKVDGEIVVHCYHDNYEHFCGLF